MRKATPVRPRMEIGNFECDWERHRNSFIQDFFTLDGVNELLSGYSGGKTPEPTYEQVCNNSTEHAEVVLIEFDESVISYEELLN